MSKFYKEISKYYSDIFPTGKSQKDFLRHNINIDKGKVLDIGCGDGGYANYLSNLGYNLTAIDLSEDMIDLLKDKNPSINSMNLNMMDIDKLDNKFNMIYCIGNTLVHLDNDEEIFSFLLKTKQILEREGKLILQIINYDRILDKNIKELPNIENEKLKFYRDYEFEKSLGKIRFETKLEVDGKTFKNIELLYPIRKNNLERLLLKSGYKKIKFYGDFKGKPYSDDSYSLIVLAK